MSPVVVCIVEGDGEVEAVPILVRRIVTSERPGAHVHVPRPILQRRDRLAGRREALERAVTLALHKAGPTGAVLVVLDADDDPACQFGPSMLRAAAAIRPGRLVSVTLAVREAEAWFLAAIESLRGLRGIAADAVAPDQPEASRGAKERIRELMHGRQKYSPVIDQPKLAAALDLEAAAQKSRSFARFRREVLRLFDAQADSGA